MFFCCILNSGAKKGRSNPSLNKTALGTFSGKVPAFWSQEGDDAEDVVNNVMGESDKEGMNHVQQRTGGGDLSRLYGTV